MMITKYKTAILALVLTFSLSSQLYTAQEKDVPQERRPEIKQPEFVSNQLIVKLKEDKSLRDIQALNSKYKVVSAEKLFKGPPTPQEALKQLKARLAQLDKEHNQWYWQLEKDSQEYKDYQAKIKVEKEQLNKQIEIQENRIQELKSAQKEASQDSALPKLDNIYILMAEGQNTDIQAMAAEYSANPSVEYAEPDYIARVNIFPQTLPNDFFADPDQNGTWSSLFWTDKEDLWGLKKIEADKAWPMSQGKDIVVAVIDTGVDYTHLDLKNNIWINTKEIAGNGIDDDANGFVDDLRGWDFIYNDNDPFDVYGHGTHVAGTIAAEGNNSIGVIGVAPQAKIMIAKGLGDDGWGSISALANCVKYAADNGAKVLNNSWGGNGSSQLITDAFHYADTKGCVAIAAAGNENSNVKDSLPANIDTVIAVAAIDSNNQKASFSNFGEKIEVASPGVAILSTVPLAKSCETAGNERGKIGHCVYNGTSMACPHTAGVAALILSKDPRLINKDVRQIIQDSSDDIGTPGKDIYFGYGRLNAQKALNLTGSYKIAVTSPADNVFIKASINVLGSTLIADFQKYELYYAPKDKPEDTTLITSSTQPVEDGLLGVWDTNKSEEGKYILSLKVFTASGKKIIRDRKVTVDNLNQPPEFLDLVNRAAVVNKLLTFKLEAKDPDDPQTPWGKLVYSVSNLPPEAQFDSETQIFSWAPGEADKGRYEVTFRLKDSGYTISKTITLFTISIEETQITNNTASQDYPDVYQDKIVWYDGRSGNSDIYMYDLNTKAEAQITNNTKDQYSPAIYQDKVVWYDYRNGNSDIYMYDLASQTESQITNNPKDQYFPSIYQDKIVWYDGRSGNSDIYMYDLNTKTETQITNNPAYQYSPDVYQDKIVWHDYRNGSDNADIYMYDLAAKTETQITTDTKNQFSPVIYQDKIVWYDWRSGNSDIYMYDLNTKTETQITNNPAYQYSPDVYQDKIVWQDNRNGNYDIYMYDLATKAEIQVTTNLGYQTLPAIYQDKIAWQDNRNGWDNSDIYLAKVTLPPYISAITPTELVVGSGIVIKGTGFGAVQGTSKVEFSDGVELPVEAWSDTQITCRANVVKEGLLRVRTKEGGISNNVGIKILPPPPTTILAQATDNIAIAKVEFYIDDALKSTDTASPYEHTFDTTAYPNKSEHALKAIAYDAAGNTAGYQIRVTIDYSRPRTSLKVSELKAFSSPKERD